MMDKGLFGVAFDPSFPLGDATQLSQLLKHSGYLVPGFIPPSVGYLDIYALRFAQDVEGYDLRVIADRNFVSRMAQACRLRPSDQITEGQMWAIRLMALCQTMDIYIDPTISFYELAQFGREEEALEELAWFRAADRGCAAQAWIDLALGRRQSLEFSISEESEGIDLSMPLRRWRRNYIAALKIAALELERHTSFDRFKILIEWMYQDFQLCGPAAIFAAVYFSGKRPGKMMKRLKSSHRGKAIEGIRNAAWDITLLSNFVDAVQQEHVTQRRSILATRDIALASIAPLTLLGQYPIHGLPSLAQSLATWWPEATSCRMADVLFDAFRAVEAEGSRAMPDGAKNIDSMIAEGEAFIYDWS